MKTKLLAVIEKIDSISSTSAGNANTLKEIHLRLDTLGNQYFSLMELNVKFLRSTPQRREIQFDEEAGILTVAAGGNAFSIKFNRAEPSVPVKLAGMTSMSGFVPQPSLGGSTVKHEAIKRELGVELENFYSNASKLWDLVEKSLCEKNKSKFIGVKMVRNKLIEHAEHGDIYSFGASETAGPTVKPIQKASKKDKWHDQGLIKNTEELLSEIALNLKSIN